MLPQAIHQSAVRTWLECPGKYYLQYILGLQDYSPEMEYGTLIHSEVEHYWRGLPYDPVIEPYIAYMAGEVGKPEVGFSVPLVHPYSGEELPLQLSGTIDLLQPDRIRDLKTSGKSWAQSKADAVIYTDGYYGKDTAGLQATLYCYAQWLKSDELLPFTFDVWRKDWTEGKRFAMMQPVTTTRTVEDFARAWSVCAQYLDDISTRTDWACRCFNNEHNLEER